MIEPMTDHLFMESWEHFFASKEFKLFHLIEMLITRKWKPKGVFKALLSPPLYEVIAKSYLHDFLWQPSLDKLEKTVEELKRKQQLEKSKAKGIVSDIDTPNSSSRHSKYWLTPCFEYLNSHCWYQILFDQTDQKVPSFVALRYYIGEN